MADRSDRNRLDTQRVLVTGAGGFLGSAVAAAARRAGPDLYELHRRPTDARATAGSAADRQCWADLTDRASVVQVMKDVRPDVVIHCAGYANAARGLAHVDPALHDNVVATVNVLSAAAEVGGIRVVHCGSVETPTPHDGADPIPNSPYAASKLAEVAYARMFHRLYGLNVCTARLAIVYGPGDVRPAKLIPSVVMSLLRGQRADLSSGRRRVDWLYVDDAAEALLACATNPALPGRTIDIGTGKRTAVAEVADSIGRLIGRSDLLRFGALPDRPDELEAQIDAAAAEADIGWRAAVSLDQGLARTIEWFRDYLAPSPAASSARLGAIACEREGGPK